MFTGLWWGNLEKRDDLGKLRRKWRVILKWMNKERPT